MKIRLTWKRGRGNPAAAVVLKIHGGKEFKGRVIGSSLEGETKAITDFVETIAFEEPLTKRNVSRAILLKIEIEAIVRQPVELYIDDVLLPEDGAPKVQALSKILHNVPN